MPVPFRSPIGFQLNNTARIVGRAFDEVLAAAGGSLPSWLILLSLQTRQSNNQRELAELVGIREATLTHHLNAMAAQGLLTRERDSTNRRIHQVRLTETGEVTFFRLRAVAIDFDQKLRTDISEDQIELMENLLHRLRVNVSNLEPNG